MRWILIVFLVVIIMMIALSISRQYREKYEFYLELKEFLSQYKLNVSFKQEKIHEFLSNRPYSKVFKPFIIKYQEYLKSGDIRLEEVKTLDMEELRELEEIVKKIGRLDAKNEILQIDSILLSIDNRLNKATSYKNKICPLILKLSLLFALGLAILLI